MPLQLGLCNDRQSFKRRQKQVKAPRTSEGLRQQERQRLAEIVGEKEVKVKRGMKM